MSKVTDAFAKHVNNEYPPEAVYFLDNFGKLHAVPLARVATLEQSYVMLGDVSQFPEYKQWERAGVLPVLSLRD